MPDRPDTVDAPAPSTSLSSETVRNDTGTLEQMNDQLPIPITPAERLLTAAEFQGLAEVPPEIEWFNNISNPGTKRVYKLAVGDFMRFTGIIRPEEFRIVTRAHVASYIFAA